MDDIVQGADGSATIYAPTARLVVGTPHDLMVQPACPLCDQPVSLAELTFHAPACGARHPQALARLLRGLRPE